MTRDVSFVLDASITMAWCFEDESNAYADAVLDSLAKSSAIAPGIWTLEVVNVLVTAERRGRIDQAGAFRFLMLLRNLPIAVESEWPGRAFAEIWSLAREYGLSSYDASYLDLAMRLGLPLATSDERLRKAAVQAGVDLFER